MKRKDAKGTRGAVYVEFLIAFFPMLCFFLCLIQFMYLEIASIMVKHAAAMTVRAAIVVIPDDPQYYGGAQPGQVTGARKQAIQDAAEMALRSLMGGPGSVQLDMKSSYTRDELVEITLNYQYKCTVPFGKFVVCDGNEKLAWTDGFPEHRKLVGKAAMPNQGADYIY